MSNQAVIGLGFGDEGKGAVTDHLSSRDPKKTIVIRFSGGQQAGHKACRGETEHIFSNFGSGTLNGCPTYWSQYCTFDPVGFRNEWKVLREKDVLPRSYIHPDCPVTTPYDMLVNREHEREKKHGTCGSGIYRTKKRHFVDGLPLTVNDLMSPDLSLDKIREYYGMSKVREEEFFEALIDLTAFIVDGHVSLRETVPDYENKVFEGSQGLMLDEHVGVMPHCTPSDITPRNAIRLANLDEVLLVTRCYGTRHGNGPLANGDQPPSLHNTEKETNHFNRYQGEFRTAALSLSVLNHAKAEGIDKVISKGTKVSLVVTCIDQPEEFCLTRAGRKVSFKSAEELVKFLGTMLRIDGDLYTNSSPYSGSIKRVG